jgi:DNA polymerase III subunit delta'
LGFEAFIGNSKAVETVRGLVTSDRVPGALLFAGPDGVGKKTLAIELAKALNCADLSPEGNACGKCKPCLKSEEMLTAGREDIERRREVKDAQRRSEGLVYFDLQVIEPITKFILIEQVRQLRSTAYTRPFELGRRVFIIDEAQTIHWQAVDLLLKVLEEPPETTTLILVCSNASALRPTIRSRCMRIPFLPVEEPLIRDLIAKEGRVPKPQQELAARIAAGSVSAAKSFDAAEYERKRKPWAGFLDLLARQRSGTRKEPDWDGLFNSTRAMTEKREDFDGTLDIGYRLLRDMELVSEYGKTAPIANIDLASHLASWAEALGLEGIGRLKEGLDEASRLQVRNVNQQLGLESLAIELFWTRSQSPGAR